MQSGFDDWLKAEGYKDRTCKTQISQVRRVENTYGDLKAACERDGFESILAALTYSSEDEAAGKPNPSPIVIQGDSIRAGLRHLRGALLRYKRFLLKEQEGASWPELKVMRGVFLERCQDFEDFDQKDGAYFDTERSYKDVLIQDAANILATVDSVQLPEVGRAFLDLMSPKRSNFVGWRTFAAIEADDVTCATISRDLAEMLLSKQEIEVSVATAAARIEPVLRKAAGGGAVFGGVRSLLTCAMALAHPKNAIDVKTRHMQKAARTLLGQGIFKPQVITREEYRQFLDLARHVQNEMVQWGWKPRDLWDVQGFFWVATDDTWKAEAGPNTSPIEDDEEESMPEKTKHPLNTILFGPPGTGKTWITARRAVEICNGTAPQDRFLLMEAYKKLVATNRIAFTTFHQSIGYEEFVEGLRPETGGDDGQSSAGFRLESKNGIFRDVCAQAEAANKRGGKIADFDFAGRDFYKMSLGKASSESHIYEAALEDSYIVLGWGGDEDWSDPKYERWQAVRDRWLEINPEATSNDPNITQLSRFRAMKPRDIVIVSEGNLRFRAIGEVAGGYQFVRGGEGGNHRRVVKWLAKLDESLPIDTIYNGRLSQVSCYPLTKNRVKLDALADQIRSETVLDNSAPEAFVLIIDEINRANVSKVFGELITLLEPDKRLGAANELTVTLPYSNQKFGVPNNLYLIGTMNTADRSIAPLDTALRRRFCFVPMMPDYTCLNFEINGVHLGRLLEAINRRIEWLFDRDHQLGHAFFIGVADKAALDDVMRNKIVPLLAEYFYDDWNKVRAALNDHGGWFLKLEKLAAPQLQSGEERERYTIVTGEVANEGYVAAAELV